MSETKDLPQYSEETLTQQITIWVPEGYKTKYATLADRKGKYRLRMAELLREVMMPKIDEAWDRATKKETA